MSLPLKKVTSPRIARNPCVSVVMPVFNETATLGPVIGAVLAQPCVRELIIVDDHSTDGSWETLQRFTSTERPIKIFHHGVNCGKGAALRTGVAKATGAIVLVQDADQEYDPREYELLIEPILAGKADVVYGSRFAGTGLKQVPHNWHFLANKWLTRVSNIFTGLNLTDMETCYKVFRREIIQGIRLEESRFGCEPEITAKMAKLGVRIFEVPISYYGRTYAEGKKTCWKDGVHAVWCILKYNLGARRRFKREPLPELAGNRGGEG